MSPDLPAAIPGAIPVVHGWRHVSHAAPPAKKAEFAATRPLADRVSDASNALGHMRAGFGPRLSPIFVPPWNRVGADLAPALAGLGYRALSTYLPRPAPEAAPGLGQVNTHVDPIDWRGTRGLVDPDTMIARTAALLADRRSGAADADEPLGLLTHHLVHDAAIWDFADRWIAEMLDGPTIPWTLPKEPAT
jgi:hypothetical protein